VNRARKDLAELRARLLLASKNGGLSPAECKQLAAPPARGRPRDLPTRTAYIAAYCLALEHANIKTKPAVEMTAEHFGCSSRTVYTARSWILSK
jgi:hypothetical protein